MQSRRDLDETLPVPHPGRPGPVLLALALTVALAPPLPAPTSTHAGPQETTASRFQELGFLAGHWRGTFQGTPYEEIYSTPEGNKILWLSKTYARGNVVAFEFGTIAVVGDQVVLTPYVNGKESVGFTLVELGSSPPLVVFANPEHDFPTRLEYRLLEEDRLRIVLTGPEGDSGPVLTADLRREGR